MKYKASGLCGMHYQRLRKTGCTDSPAKVWPLPGARFQMLTLVADLGYDGRDRMGVFRCDCGDLTKPTRISSVELGYQKSCGCVRKPVERSTCSVEGCTDTVYYPKYGYCSAHYRRWRKYGDPTAGGIRHGDAQRFACEVATSETDDCITWPYGGTSTGYGRINAGGTSIGAHVHIATLAHGPKPTDRHECCHSCGNGHLGCVNPRHLYWGTRSDNVQDMIRHGTHYRGGSKVRWAHRSVQPRA
ncbi:MAG: HNH endonuclease [Methylobacterium radiotolerans]